MGNKREKQLLELLGCRTTCGTAFPAATPRHQLPFSSGSVPHALMENQERFWGFLWDLLVAALMSEPGLSSEKARRSKS